MKKLVRTLQQYAEGKIVLATFILSMFFYIVIIFYSIPSVVAAAPDMKLFDLLPTGYSFDYALSLLNAIEDSGRHAYLAIQLPIDFIYPLTFAVSHALIVVWLLSKSAKLSSKLYYLAVLPILTGFFDYAENISVLVILNSFPDISESLVNMASTMTIIKSSFATASYILICVLLFHYGWKVVINKKRRLVQ